MLDRYMKIALFMMSLFLMSPAFALMPNIEAADVGTVEESTPVYQEAASSDSADDGGLEVTMSEADKERWERALRVLEMQAEEEARTGKVIQVKSGASAKRCSKYSGGASFYGNEFQGRKTASGARFDQKKRTAAHKTLPMGTVVKVRNKKNGKVTTVQVNDCGPFIKGRIIDLSRVAAQDLGMIQAGHTQVEVEVCI